MKVLVTGGAGFIGSHIVEALLKNGHTVRIADNMFSGKMENIQPFLDDIEFVQMDVADIANSRKAVAGMDAVFHEAAIASVPRSVDDPATSNRAGIDGILNMLIASRDEKVERFIFAASSAAYGDDPTMPKVESMPPRPLSPYAITKVAGEYYCKAFYDLYGLKTIALRYFNVFGPRQDPKSEYAAVIPKFISSLVKGERPTIYGDGEQSRDFIYIDNVVKMNLLALETNSGFGECYNTAEGESTSLNQLWQMLKEITGSDIEPVYAEARAGDVKHSLADISKARRELGYTPVVEFTEGLSRTVHWFQSAERR